MNYKHGMRDTKIWCSWRCMKTRCLNPNNFKYKDYGGRGIEVCEKWLNFQGFFEDMGVRPEGMTLERKNNSLGYYKENCKWATPKEQASNRRWRGTSNETFFF